LKKNREELCVRLLAKLGMERRTQAAVFISKLDQSHRRPQE
jgi:two-component system, NarL family, response regulator DevR